MSDNTIQTQKEFMVVVNVGDDPYAAIQDVYTEEDISRVFPSFEKFILSPGFRSIEWVADLTHVKIDYLDYD